MKVRIILIFLTMLHFIGEIFFNTIYLFFLILESPIFLFSDKIFSKFLNIVRVPGIKLKEKNNA